MLILCLVTLLYLFIGSNLYMWGYMCSLDFSHKGSCHLPLKLSLPYFWCFSLLSNESRYNFECNVEKKLWEQTFMPCSLYLGKSLLSFTIKYDVWVGILTLNQVEEVLSVLSLLRVLSWIDGCFNWLFSLDYWSLFPALIFRSYIVDALCVCVCVCIFLYGFTHSICIWACGQD